MGTNGSPMPVQTAPPWMVALLAQSYGKHVVKAGGAIVSVSGEWIGILTVSHALRTGASYALVGRPNLKPASSYRRLSLENAKYVLMCGGDLALVSVRASADLLKNLKPAPYRRIGAGDREMRLLSWGARIHSNQLWEMTGFQRCTPPTPCEPFGFSATRSGYALEDLDSGGALLAGKDLIGLLQCREGDVGQFGSPVWLRPDGQSGYVEDCALGKVHRCLIDHKIGSSVLCDCTGTGPVAIGTSGNLLV